MSRHIVASLLLLTLLACSGSESPELNPAGSDVGDGAAQQASAGQPPQGGTGSPGSRGEQEPEIDPSQPAVLVVRLHLKGSDKPMGNVPFDVQWTDEGAPSKTASRTDPDGSRTIAFAHGSQLIAIIPRSSPYTAPVFHQDKTLLMGGRTHTVDIELPPGGITTGVVLDEAGEPVPHVTVTAFFHAPDELDLMRQPQVDTYTETDEEGRFALGGFPAGPFVIESGDATRVAVFRPGGLIKEGQRIDGLEVQLEPAHAVYGQVTDQEEHGIPGARIVSGKPLRRQNRKPTAIEGIWLYQPRAIVTISDEDGLFTLAAVPESQTWNINVSHPEYRRYTGHFEAGQVEVWVTLESGAALEGKVVDGEGKDLAQVQVWLLLPASQETVFTDFQGKFRFAGRSNASGVYLLFYKPGAGMHLEGPMDLAASSPSVDVELEGGQTLSGRVVDAEGAPVVGAMVTIEGRLPAPDFQRARMPERFLELDAQLSNAQGEFRFDELDENHFTIRASLPGKGEAIAPNIPTGRPNLVLQLDS